MPQKKVHIICCADDEGVSNVGGRTGAAAGPESFKAAYAKFSGRENIRLQPEFVFVNFSEGDSLDTKHQKAADAISASNQEDALTILVGGGHDFAYSHLKGLVNFFDGEKIGCINIDPHLDMRSYNEKVSSGCPFRLSIDEGLIAGENLTEFGIQRQCNAPALFEYAAEKNVRIRYFDDALRNGNAATAFRQELSRITGLADKIMISLDLDALQASFAPGVSAPAAEGFTPTDVMQMMEIAAAEPKVVSLGIYELNPSLDIDNRTSRLAALAAFRFLESK